jgi:hypothetical protein
MGDIMIIGWGNKKWLFLGVQYPIKDPIDPLDRCRALSISQHD